MMGTSQPTKLFHRTQNLLFWLRKSTAPRGRRIFHRDVEHQQEFRYATACCLSSYYSVFVARLAIMVMLAILIGLLTMLTWHFTKTYTARSLDSLAYGLRYEILQRPILRMWSILNSTSEITTSQGKLSEYVIRRYSKPTNQAEQVELYEAMRDVTWALFASRKALNAITINFRNGFVQAFHRDHRSNNTFYIYSDLSNYSINSGDQSYNQGWKELLIHSNISAIWYREPLDPTTGEKIGKPMRIPPEDLINIAGISQVPDGVASWHVMVSKYVDSPLLSAALPVSDPANESIVAVVGVTMALYSVGQLMKELVEFHSGHIYLTSQEGYLLASSGNAPLLTNNATVGPKLMTAIESKDDVIRMGADWLKRSYRKKYPPSHEVHAENVRLGNEQYYIDSFSLNLKRLPLVGVIIIPRRYIMGKVDERAFKTLVILISASLCMLVIGCVCILILTNGVSKEMKLRAELISHFDARRRAEASNNYKTQFLANMSHELRTPMAAVIGLLDILICDDCLTNEQYSTVTQIRKCSMALLRLLNNILDLSKVESGKLVLEEAEFDLVRELEGLVDMFSVQCINHNVETVLDLSDDIPKLVRGDSARVVQVFANLISNSIKFTTSGHVLVRGWCENPNSFNNDKKRSSRFGNRTRMINTRKDSRKENKMTLWFEVDDTGCGIDPSKSESVFESFEQADPSTSRTHGGTGLGLCIVRNLVNKMGGEIKVVKKHGPGTLMRLYLVLSTPLDSIEQHFQTDFAKHNIVLLLAIRGRTSRFLMSKWLKKIGLLTLEASEWNELTQILQELYWAKTSSVRGNGLMDGQDYSLSEHLRDELVKIQDNMRNRVLVPVVDIGLLDLSTDIWKEQLNFLEKYSEKAKFAWILNHDTSNSVKTKLREKGHDLMVNKPLYKAKMVHILEAVVKEKNAEKRSSKEGDFVECLEIDSSHDFDRASSDDSDISIELSHVCTSKGSLKESSSSLEGLHILLAEDTPVLQRVASIMLEKMGATVIAVEDGLQAVDALESLFKERKRESRNEISEHPSFDLVLMDCQMPRMDGYEATKAIRKAEIGTRFHIPIVALTAHAMSSDEAKCFEVGMDAYLTKPIDYKLMVSTILSLTKRRV